MRLPGLLLLLCMLGQFGCAYKIEHYTAQPLNNDTNVTLQQNEIIIFGRILFVENGNSVLPYGFQTKPSWGISSQLNSPDVTEQIEMRMISSLSARKDGIFIYVIPAGHYEVAHVHPFYYLPYIIPSLEFTAITPGIAYYLGDLELDYDSTSLLGGLWGNYIKELNYLEVVDRYREVCEQVSVTLGDKFVVPTKKALMTRIWGNTPYLQERDSTGSLILESFWKIK